MGAASSVDHEDFRTYALTPIVSLPTAYFCPRPYLDSASRQRHRHSNS